MQLMSGEDCYKYAPETQVALRVSRWDTIKRVQKSKKGIFSRKLADWCTNLAELFSNKFISEVVSLRCTDALFKNILSPCWGTTMFFTVMEQWFRIRANSPSFVWLNRSCQLPLVRTFCLLESNPKRHPSDLFRRLVNAKSDMFNMQNFQFLIIFLQTVLAFVLFPEGTSNGVHLESHPLPHVRWRDWGRESKWHAQSIHTVQWACIF